MRKYGEQDRKLLASWAAGCASRVLPLFEEAHPGDGRPRRAIEACRAWVRTGAFRMDDIRGASLAAHAAARKVKGNGAACFAARAAGQAAASAHVPQHAFGASYYALKAVAASAGDEWGSVSKERAWQARRLPGTLRAGFLGTVTVRKGRGKVLVRVIKGRGF
jgi:hypothetical protein